MNEEDVKQIDSRFKTRRDIHLDKEKETRRVNRLASTLAITLDDYKYALRKFRGNFKKASDFLGVERAVLARKVETTPSLRYFVKGLEDETTDGIEEKLVELAEGGVLPAVTFYLKTKAKDRGYTEKVETTTDPIVLANSAAALIEAMKRGAKPQLEDKNTIDAEAESWQTIETE